MAKKKRAAKKSATKKVPAKGGRKIIRKSKLRKFK